MTVFASSVALATATPSQDTDTIYRLDPRSGDTEVIQGTVTGDTLTEMTYSTREEEEDTIDSLQVVRVVWGEVPTEFADGEKLERQGAFEDAVKSYRDVASDGDARGPVRAAAHMAAIEAMMKWGEEEPARFNDAVAEADRFLSERADSRFVPKVRMAKARATWLGGDAAAAHDGYLAIHDTGAGGSEGYGPMLTAEAALQSAHAALDAENGAGARTAFGKARTAFEAIAGSDEARFDDGDRARATGGAEVAALADPLAKVAGGDFAGARGALERALESSETSAGKAAARLGLAEVLLGVGENFEAVRHFSWIAAMDHTSADRRARALMGLADAMLALSPDSGAAAAKSALDRVVSEYGGTSSARSAAERLRSM